MKVIIIYDTVFNNTKKVAESMASELETNNEVVLTQVNNASKHNLNEFDMIILGSPTRAFNPTKPISSYINSIKVEDITGKSVLLFDTRISAHDVNSKVFNVFEKRFGYATDTMTKKLTKKDADILDTKGFFVSGNEGPMNDGEFEKAQEWVSSFVNK